MRNVHTSGIEFRILDFDNNVIAICILKRWVILGRGESILTAKAGKSEMKRITNAATQRTLSYAK
jgi:hypothetical protein